MRDGGPEGRADILDVVLKLSPVTDAEADGRTRITIDFEKGRALAAADKQSFVATLEPHPIGGLTWSRSVVSIPVGDRVREMLLDGMPPMSIATELHAATSYVYRIQKQMIVSGELRSSKSTSRDSSPAPPLGGARGGNARWQGNSKGKNRGIEGNP